MEEINFWFFVCMFNRIRICVSPDNHSDGRLKCTTGWPSRSHSYCKYLKNRGYYCYERRPYTRLPGRIPTRCQLNMCQYIPHVRFYPHMRFYYKNFISYNLCIWSLYLFFLIMSFSHETLQFHTGDPQYYSVYSNTHLPSGRKTRIK